MSTELAWLLFGCLVFLGFFSAVYLVVIKLKRKGVIKANRRPPEERSDTPDEGVKDLEDHLYYYRDDR